MKKGTAFILAALLAAAPALAGQALLDKDFRRLAGKEVVNLQQAYGGQVLLVVNTASKCGFTPQYEGLESLYKSNKDAGLVVLGDRLGDLGDSQCNHDPTVFLASALASNGTFCP